MRGHWIPTRGLRTSLVVIALAMIVAVSAYIVMSVRPHESRAFAVEAIGIDAVPGLDVSVLPIPGTQIFCAYRLDAPYSLELCVGSDAISVCADERPVGCCAACRHLRESYAEFQSRLRETPCGASDVHRNVTSNQAFCLREGLHVVNMEGVTTSIVLPGEPLDYGVDANASDFCVSGEGFVYHSDLGAMNIPPTCAPVAVACASPLLAVRCSDGQVWSRDVQLADWTRHDTLRSEVGALSVWGRCVVGEVVGPSSYLQASCEGGIEGSLVGLDYLPNSSWKPTSLVWVRVLGSSVVIREHDEIFIARRK